MDYSILKVHREAKKLSQDQLAAKVGLTGAYISYVERGLKSPRVETLEYICKALDLVLEINEKQK